jgi:hypothetical protein
VHSTILNESEDNLGGVKGETSSQTSAELVRTYSAIVDALTATILNAEAGLNWLNTQPPDLEAVRQALNTIVTDGKRAGEIVVRFGACMKSSPVMTPNLEPMPRRGQSSEAV